MTSHADDHTHADVNLITAQVMTRLSQSLKEEASRQLGPLVLDHALTKPKAFEDGTALFLFNTHREAIGQSIRPILLLVSYNETAVVTMLALRPNDDDLSKSLIIQWTNEQKEEILRQLSVANLGAQSRILSAVLLDAKDIPKGAAITRGDVVELNNVMNANVVTDVEHRPIPDSAPDAPTPVQVQEELPTQETWNQVIRLVQQIREGGYLGDVDSDDIYNIAVVHGFTQSQTVWNSIAPIVLNGIREASMTPPPPAVPSRPTPVV